MTGEITMDTWNALATPPDWAVTPIKGGVLGKLGYHDIDPIWRLEKLTEVYGPVGEGWTWEIVATGVAGDIFYIHGRLRTRDVDGSMSDPWDGIGGNDLWITSKDGRERRANKEAIKGAETAALAAACKKLGMGASVYKGKFDGSYASAAALLSASEAEHLMSGGAQPPVDDVPPVCKCGQPANRRTGTSKVGKAWAAYVCAVRKSKTDPNGCDFWEFTR
jgi:hypothetical protein